MKKGYQRGPQKLCFWIQNGDMGVPGSAYRLIFDVLLRCQKIIIFGRLPDGPKNRKNRALERQGPKGSKRDDPQEPPGTPPPPTTGSESLKTKLHEDQASDSDSKTKTQTQIHRLRFRFRFKDSDSYQTQTRRLKDC